METDISLKDFLKEVLEPIIDDCLTRSMNKYINSRVLEPAEYSSVFDMDEASKYMKLSKSAIYALTHKSIIPHYKQGRHLFFRKEELDEWINKGKVAIDDFQSAANRYRPI